MNNVSLNVIEMPVTRVCTGCKVEKNVVDFYFRKTNPRTNASYQCKECENKKNKEYQRKLRKEQPKKIEEYQKDFNRKNPKSSKDKSYKSKYGISLEQAVKMLEQQFGLCANRACGKEIFFYTDKRNLVANIDHCHTTGKVRGILCTSCNLTLGLLENKNKVLGLTEYLQRYGVK